MRGALKAIESVLSEEEPEQITGYPCDGDTPEFLAEEILEPNLEW